MTVNRSSCTLGTERCEPRSVAEHTHCVARHSDKAAQKLAENIGVGYDWFTKATSDSGKAVAPTWLMLALSINTGRTEHIEALAHEAGLVCYRMPAGKTSADLQTAEAIQEFGEFLTELARSLADRRVTQDEADRVKEEGRQAIARIAALIDHVQDIVSEERTRPQAVGVR
jgi:hypothetical protein